MEENRMHKVVIEDRARLTVSGVDDVESFDDEKVIISTDMGTMTVLGGDFRINKLNVDEGQIIIEGEIDEIQYTDTISGDKGGGFFGKLFK